MIAVIGLGFVGLTTALGLANKCDQKVFGYDIDNEKRQSLKNGELPFYEPYLKDYLKKEKDSRFFICDSLKEAILNAHVIFYCVGTPSKEDGEADLDILTHAITSSLKYMDKLEYKTLVIKSSVPPTTTLEQIQPIIEKAGFEVGKDIGLTNNPEFLREGFAWKDFVEPDRVVIGESDTQSGEIVESIFKSFDCPIYRVSLNTGEFIKYLSNNLLSTLISFSNEMSMIADSLGGIDTVTAFNALHLDKRWKGSPAKMSTYVFPGCGFGGYCLPKDTSALYNIAKRKGYEASLIKDLLSINEKIKEHLVKKIIKVCQPTESIGILGLSFKPESDDVRETSSKYIIEMLLEKGFKNIIAYDPLAIENFKNQYGLSIAYADSLDDLINKADVFVLLTAWQEFIENKDIIKSKRVIDGRYCL